MMNFPEMPLDKPTPKYLLMCDLVEDHGIVEGEDYYQSKYNDTIICEECASLHRDFLDLAGYEKKTANAWDLEMEALGI